MNNLIRGFSSFSGFTGCLLNITFIPDRCSHCLVNNNFDTYLFFLVIQVYIPVLGYCHFIHEEQIYTKWKITNIFVRENSFQNIFCKLTAILFRTRSFNACSWRHKSHQHTDFYLCVQIGCHRPGDSIWWMNDNVWRCFKASWKKE